MKRKVFIAAAGLALIAVATASTYAWTASTAGSDPDAISAAMTAIGQKSGNIAGDGPGGAILVSGLSHDIISPRDAASGLPTGKRQHKPMVITKELDRSTPLLLQALVTNENLTKVVFTFFRSSNSKPYMEVTLTNASVSERQQHGEREQISFTYQKITWKWLDGGITAEDDWETPVT